MKMHRLGKRKNSRNAREAKESEGKPKKVPAEETANTKMPNDLDLAIAQMLYRRTSYNSIADRSIEMLRNPKYQST